MHNLPPLIDIGLTDLPKPGWEIAHSAHPSSTPLQFYYSLFVTEKQITVAMTSTPTPNHNQNQNYRSIGNQWVRWAIAQPDFGKLKA